MRDVGGGGHGGDLVAASRRFNRPPAKFVDFSSNVNPLGPPGGLLAHLRRHLGDISRYPPTQAAPFRRELAEHLGLPEERLLVGNGANELLHLLTLYLRPRRVLLAAPSFAEYRRAAELVEAAVEYFPLPPGLPAAEARVPEALETTDLLVLGNPNNPTGIYYPRSFMEGAVGIGADRGAAVVVDESFMSFTGRPSEDSLSYLEEENLWVVVSLTKAWALPGLRLGYLVGPSAGVGKLTVSGDPWRVNALAQRAGSYCLRRRDYLDRTLRVVRRERDYLLRELGRIDGLESCPGEANYLLLRGVRPGFNAQSLYDYLGSRGILIRRAANYQGLDETFFRVAVRRRRENRRLTALIGRYFAD